MSVTKIQIFKQKFVKFKLVDFHEMCYSPEIDYVLNRLEVFLPLLMSKLLISLLCSDALRRKKI